jgi:hypothetical protein
VDGAPLLSLGTTASTDVSVFFVSDGRLVFLQLASIPEESTVNHGSVIAREMTADWGAGAMSEPPFWQTHPRREWSAYDRAEWRRAGSPRLPYRPLLEEMKRKPLDQVQPLVSPPPVASLDGGLYAPPRPRHQSARSASVDRLLKSMGIR